MKIAIQYNEKAWRNQVVAVSPSGINCGAMYGMGEAKFNPFRMVGSKIIKMDDYNIDYDLEKDYKGYALEKGYLEVYRPLREKTIFKDKKIQLFRRSARKQMNEKQLAAWKVVHEQRKAKEIARKDRFKQWLEEEKREWAKKIL